jgi:histidinol phosphatase-like enzyme (inositol monophosphatase family)
MAPPTSASRPPVDPALLAEAVELVQEAGRLTLQWFRSPDLAIDRKGDGTPVTAADRAAERFLREQFAERYPTDGVLGEEEAETLGTSGRRWVLDPIDGTKAFSHGVPLYSNLLALEDEHGPAIGIINLPALGETVAAGRGLGCTCNGEPVRVNDRATLDGSYVTTSSFDPWDDGLLARARATEGLTLRTWGDGYGYALVATGRVEAMVDPLVEYYDVAPMAVILEEAGGRFTDFDGNVAFGSGNGFATNGRLHDDVLALLRG